MARVVYLALFYINAIIAALLRIFGIKFLGHFSYLFHFVRACQEDVEEGFATQNCIGNQIVYRLSFSLCFFFVFTSLLSCILARGVQNCCCLVFFQVPVYLLIVAMTCLLFPNEFFQGYADFARIGAGTFIVLQIIIIVDSTYNFRDLILDKIEEAEQEDEAREVLLDTNYETVTERNASNKWIWEALYIFVVVLFTGLTVTGVILEYKYFGSCGMNVFFTTLTLLCCLLLTGLSVTSWVNVGLLPSSAVCLYLVFLCYQVLASNPDRSCLAHSFPWPFHSRDKSVWVNAATAAFSITWTSYQTSNTRVNLLTLPPSPTREEQMMKIEDQEDLEKEIYDEGQLLLKKRPVSFSMATTSATQRSDLAPSTNIHAPEFQFHMLMVLGGLYMAMMLTNWESSTGHSASVQDGLVNMWVKVISEWVAAGIFLWTLIAPTVLPDRDFGAL